MNYHGVLGFVIKSINNTRDRASEEIGYHSPECVGCIKSIPKLIYKTAANKILVIGTKLGFIIISILFLVLGFLQNSHGASNSYHVKLVLSWIGVGVNIAIILFHIIVRIIEFFRQRKEKKGEAEKEKRKRLENKTSKKDYSTTKITKHRSKIIRLPDNHTSNNSNDQIFDKEIPKIFNRFQLKSRRVDIINSNTRAPSKRLQLSHKYYILLSYSSSQISLLENAYEPLYFILR